MNQTPSVTVVDDDDAVRNSLRLLLKSVGLPTVTHASAQAFLDAWQPRSDQACNTVVMAAAMLDPRYKNKLSSMPADHQLRAQAFIVQQTKKLWGDAAGVRVQVRCS